MPTVINTHKRSVYLLLLLLLQNYTFKNMHYKVFTSHQQIT